MLPEIKTAYLSGRIMLFLGAGASHGSNDETNAALPMGDRLAGELAALMGWPYNGEPLSNVYSAMNAVDSFRLQAYLRKRLSNTKPSHDLATVASFCWSRIYTLNIDDCMETAIRRTKTQTLQLFSRNAPLEEMDPIFKCVQIIKLNGSADRPDDGFIFSPQEYGEGASRLPIWYRELGQNQSSYTFIFIGSKLNEPLFQHAMAEMRSIIKRAPVRGYVLTPSASEIEKHHLSSLNLQHVPATIAEFASWLEHEMPTRPTGWDLATARRPELRNIQGALSDSQKRALNSVTLVDAAALPKVANDKKSGVIREFYKGYKPRWADIIDNVPADLAFIGKFARFVETGHGQRKCIALLGPAGSGKTTALMTTALRVSQMTDRPVYYLREAVDDIKDIVSSLEQINDSPFFLFIDKIESMHNELSEFLYSSRAKNVCIVFSERLNIWHRRVKSTLGPHVSHEQIVGKISKADATKLLEKLETFGPWTRLQPMKPDQRVSEVYNNADRQLLIGLMEATTGLGFGQIIRNDFQSVGEDRHKRFLVIVGFASIHRSTLSSHIVGSALSNLGIAEDVNVMSRETEGIVVSGERKYSARHPAYVRELFERVVPTGMIRDCLVAVLNAFADYEAPVMRNVSKPDGMVFKSIMNHRFVNEMMKNDEDQVRSIYEKFETRFHVDGLYWLQYGLALRDFDRQHEALEKLKTARQAFVSPQIDHAYAQQLLIIANKATFWQEAEPLLKEAIDTLRQIAKYSDAGDNYAIVTLAEGHISVILKFFGKEGVQALTQQYANELLVAHHKNPSSRVSDAVQRILQLSENGKWKEFQHLEFDEH